MENGVMALFNIKGVAMIAGVAEQVRIVVRDDVASTVALEKLNVPFVIEQVRLGDVETADDTFQTRLGGGAFQKSMAADYSEKMKKGDIFPEITVQRKSRGGRFRVVCGRHRLHAMLLAFGPDAVVACKVVSPEIPVDTLKCVGLRDNTTNGLQQVSADAAKYVARLLVKASVEGNGIEHSNRTLNAYAINAGASPATVRTNYHALLGENVLVSMGIDVSAMTKGVLAELWRTRTAAAFNDIVAAVKEFPSLEKLEGILKKARISKADPFLIPQQIREAGNSHFPASGKYYSRKADPVDVLIQHMVLSERAFASLEPRRNLDEERADEIMGAVECIRRAAKAWRDR